MPENENPCPENATHVGQLLIRTEKFACAYGVLYCPIHDKDYPVPGQPYMWNHDGKMAHFVELGLMAHAIQENRLFNDKWTTGTADADIQKFKDAAEKYKKKYKEIGDVNKISKAELFANIARLKNEK